MSATRTNRPDDDLADVDDIAQLCVDGQPAVAHPTTVSAAKPRDSLLRRRLSRGLATSTTGADVRSLLERIEQLEARSSRLDVDAQPANGEQPAVTLKANGEASAKDEDDEDIPAPPLVLSSVTMWMVENTKTRTDALRAAVWLIFGLTFAMLEIVSLISVGIALQWKPCFAQEDCRIGLVCISFLDDEPPVYSRMTCEDCYFVARDETVAAPTDWLYADIISPEDRLGFGGSDGSAVRGRRPTTSGSGLQFYEPSNSTVSASEHCLRKLNEKAVALFEPDDSVYFGGSAEPPFAPHYRECHFVKEALMTMSALDVMVVLLVLLLVAFGVAEDYSEQLHVRRIRQISLPLTLLPRARTLGATLRWLAILVMVATEFLMSLVEPLVPFSIIMLLVTQGCDSASALLNGLAMGFVLQIDDLVPVIMLGPRDSERITSWLTQEANDAFPKKQSRGLYGFHRIAAYRSAAVVATSFLIQVIVLFQQVPKLICEMVLHHLHYRATILYGVWVVGSVNLAVEKIGRLLIFVNEGHKMSHMTLSRRTALRYVGREALVVIEHFAYMLVAAFTLNVLYWYIANVLYYGMDLKYSFEAYFEDFVLDLFGACGKGYYHNECLSQGPPGWDGAYAPSGML